MTDARQIAAPILAVGDEVDYNDRNNRVQGNAKVLGITAYWTPVGCAPFVIYEVTHPTYRNRRAYIGQGDIIPRITK